MLQHSVQEAGKKTPIKRSSEHNGLEMNGSGPPAEGRMTPSLNMPGRLRRITSPCPNDYFLFLKLKEHLSGTRFSSESDVKTVAENWLNGLYVISAKPG
ncbi:hypothetical protein AVEN_172808-1 [Araneus ventricosus]|uniref:Uncharacterized protein n=1 Tax=Araneus ventricosus TaxID=182803 RepID=A0A4Y2BIY4_ARAVE|nr:hypothetical protein AVEN_172808-1 [Araneus ventricosus]